jgi:hypothetical protein
MSDEIIRRLLKRREAALRELERVDELIKLYQEVKKGEAEKEDTSNEFSILFGPLVGENVRPHQRRPPTYVSPSQKVRPKDVGPIARRLMLDNGHPMTRTELLDALKKSGVRLAGTDEARYLGTIMWRLRDEFINIEGHGYWPRDIPCEAVGYVPGGDEENEHPSG